MSEQPFPYNLPIWRRSHRAVSPSTSRVAVVDPAWEVGMSLPTSGTLCVGQDLHIDRCNPSFIWSDDSRYLAVPRFFEKLLFFRRQQLLIVDFEERRVYASLQVARYFQPESFERGQLTVHINPWTASRPMTFSIPDDLHVKFELDRSPRWART